MALEITDPDDKTLGLTCFRDDPPGDSLIGKPVVLKGKLTIQYASDSDGHPTDLVALTDCSVTPK